jgi:hypothetical protein
LIVNKDEIEQLIEVPLSALIDFTNLREEVYFIDGSEYLESIFDYKGYVIWGATARIMKQFLDLLISDCPECLK